VTGLLHESQCLTHFGEVWETDLVAKTKLWTPEGMALFGINLPDGRGHAGGAQGPLSGRERRKQLSADGLRGSTPLNVSLIPFDSSRSKLLYRLQRITRTIAPTPQPLEEREWSYWFSSCDASGW